MPKKFDMYLTNYILKMRKIIPISQGNIKALLYFLAYPYIFYVVHSIYVD